MEGLDLKQMTQMVKIIAEEKNLPEDTVLDVIETAIAAAWRKENGDRDMDVRAVLNLKSGAATVFVMGEDEKEEKHEVKTFGRVAAMTAKQVIVQRLREAERDAVLEEYEEKIGTIMTGLVSRVDPRVIRIDIGRATGIMPRSEQIEGEYHSAGERIRVYLKKIERGDKGAQLILSRGCPEFVEELFRQEVPELETGAVEIKGIAREAGRRTKIAVTASAPGIDPVGTFVGGRGIRIQTVMDEIGDREKIDIVNWSDNTSEYIREALSPAEIMKIEINDKKAQVFVTEDQQSLAIGKQGQNVRLASKLTGYEIEINVAQKPAKKKKKNVEDALLSAIEESGDEE